MEYGLMFEILFSAIGGLGIFLYGMNHLSTGLQTVAGEKLKTLIGKVTSNRIFAVTIGALVTMIIQSSSITTVMTVGFVNAGLMNLTQAIGVIMGSNIGTTLTGWILVVKVGKYGLPILGIAIFFVLFSKKTKTKYIATAVMGLGMIFFGLELMKNGFKPIRSMPEFRQWFEMFSPDTYLGLLKCIMAGAILTIIVQSSSATMGITIGLATTGVIPFPTAAALVLGENIGTTITAFLASFGTGKNAKRAAYAHIVFNILGVMWISFLFKPYIDFIAKLLGNNPDATRIGESGVVIYPYIGTAIAMTHSIFNVTNTIVFLPFIGIIKKVLVYIIPDRDGEERKNTHLDERMLETPMMVIDQTQKEMLNVGQINLDMFDALEESINKSYDTKNKTLKSVFENEDKIDLIQKEISEILTELFSPDLARTTGLEVKKYLKVADEYESISDYIMKILKLYLKLRNKEIEMSKDEKEMMMELQKEVVDYLIFINGRVGDTDLDHEFSKDIYLKSTAITKKFKAIRKKHFNDAGSYKMDPLLITSYTDILNSYRKIKNHILNVGEALIEESEELLES
ncbi:MAG: Na/Pi cotransporter family protein [Fusobacteriota bacterium]